MGNEVELVGENEEVELLGKESELVEKDEVEELLGNEEGYIEGVVKLAGVGELVLVKIDVVMLAVTVNV